MRRPLVSAAVLAAALAGPAAAQTGRDGATALLAPATVTHDERGRATVRAVRIAEPLRLDGRLDEEVYRITLPIDGFRQQVPVEGAPATQPTEMWVFFDDERLYVAARCLDSQPDRIIANELRRDGSAIPQNDNFGDRDAAPRVAHGAARIQLAHPVQSERPFAHIQCAGAMGILAWQRSVHRLQRRPEPRLGARPEPADAIVRDQGDAPVSACDLRPQGRGPRGP